MSNNAKIREEAKKFPFVSDSKRWYIETDEGQQTICEIMERLKEEDRMRINRLNAILLKEKRYDDLERITYDAYYQEQLMEELLSEIQNT